MSTLAPKPIVPFVALTSTSERGKSPKIVVWRRKYWEGVAGERLGPLTTTMPHRVRAPPICTLGYAAALSKGNRAFALRGSRSNRGARTTGANAGRTLERPVTKFEEQYATQVVAEGEELGSNLLQVGQCTPRDRAKSALNRTTAINQVTLPDWAPNRASAGVTEDGRESGGLLRIRHTFTSLHPRCFACRGAPRLFYDEPMA